MDRRDILTRAAGEGAPVLRHLHQESPLSLSARTIAPVGSASRRRCRSIGGVGCGGAAARKTDREGKRRGGELRRQGVGLMPHRVP